MKCKQCNHKMIAISDFTYDEVMNFIEGDREFYALVLIEKRTDLWGSITTKKSLNFRKMEAINKNTTKLYGLKLPLVDGKAVIERKIETITYTLLEMRPQIIEVIAGYMADQNEDTYSNTKLNNYLWKRSPLKQLYGIKNTTQKINKVEVEEYEGFPF